MARPRSRMATITSRLGALRPDPRRQRLLIFGHTDVKELALYIEDQIKAGNWDFNLGMRGDLYNGLASRNQPEPRVGIAYNVKPSATVLAASYARTTGDALQRKPRALQHRMLRRGADAPARLQSRRRRNPRSRASATSSMPVCSRPSARMPWSAASTSGSTPTTPSTSASWAIRPSPSPSTGITPRFPATRCTPNSLTTHGFSAYFVTSSVAARFFGPQVAGAGATSGVARDLSLPHRSRREVQPDHAPPVHALSRWQLGERTVGRL